MFLTTLFAGPYGLLLKIAAVAAIVGAIWLHGRSSGVKSMVPEVEAAQSQAALWQKTAENRLGLIQAQNQAVEGLKASFDMKYQAMQKKLAVANSEASKFRDIAERRAEILSRLELPENECQALTIL